MVEINSTILYGSQVCKVADIKDLEFGKTRRKYYILSPIFDDKNTIYVPCDNEALCEKMRKILSHEEIVSLIKNLPQNEKFWVEDDKERAIVYKGVLESGDREKIIRIIKTLYEHKTELQNKGKKLRSSDELIFARAEKILYDEFSLVLNIKREEVVSFIIDNM